ncbi:MAG: hypothetical protein JXA82_17885 [Sedimentisphaerales bacterium]|nr:hypothetical protein [Sedimentisphaerales bacterium]
METKRRNVSKLAAFARQHCANWDNGQNSCIFRIGCRIAAGMPCEYFKKAVWPICDPAYPYATETHRYEELLAQYRQIDKDLVVSDEDESLRLCDCGEPLKQKRQLCDECRKKRRRKTWKEQKQKQRVRCPTIL